MSGFVKRSTTKRRLEPEGNVVLHGAGQSPEAFRSYYALLSPTVPCLYMTYIGLGSRNVEDWLLGLDEELRCYKTSPVPQIGLSMTKDGEPWNHYDQRVATGEFDENIERLCAGLAKLGRPVFIRLGYEFNGEWNGYEPEGFRRSWIRVWNALRRHGLDDVALVWCYAPDAEMTADHRPFYPGDEYVDWWSVDLFSTRDFFSPKVHRFLDEAEERRFPVMIGETAPRYVGVEKGIYSWDQWFQPYFSLIHARPCIKATCYINWNWAMYPQWLDWGDSRIGENHEVLSRYRREMAMPWYGHGSVDGN
ncbi:MAG: hypothetical protein GF344_01425 [Chitinivibrionales bacterium]|nr:hypothetical protein [Chitinivibrionales bacterium]MBD3355755.1 hypothetical protein [Chitinivibrionales bacterium]